MSRTDCQKCDIRLEISHVINPRAMNISHCVQSKDKGQDKDSKVKVDTNGHVSFDLPASHSCKMPPNMYVALV